MVEGVAVLCRLQVPGVPHFGGLHDRLAGLVLDLQGPEFAPFGRFVGLVVHAVKHIGIGPRAFEQLDELGLLVAEHKCVIFQGGYGMEEGIFFLARV